MSYIQQTAEQSVISLMKELATKSNNNLLDTNELSYFEAIDQMDDGTKIKLNIQINKQTGMTCFDFTGTGDYLYIINT